MSANFKSSKKKSQDSAEDKKKKKYKSIVTTLLENNPITGPSTRIFNLLKGKLTKEKELDLDQLIKDLKEEQKEAAKEAANKNNPSKEINKKKRDFGNYQKLRSSKDKKFQGHTGRGG